MRLTRAHFIRLFALVATAHFCVTLASVATSYGSGMTRFDAPAFQSPSTLEVASAALAGILVQPAYLLVKAFWPIPHSGLLQWLVLACNSALWAFVLSAVIWRLARRSTRTRLRRAG